MKLNKITSLRTFNETDPVKHKEIVQGISFVDTDSRNQKRIKMLRMPHLKDKFSDFLVSEYEVKHLLAGWLLFLLLLFFLVLVV